MLQSADLELSFYKLGENRYKVEMRFTQPDSAADIRAGMQNTISFHLDASTLRQFISEPLEYGKFLADALFADPEMRLGWQKVCTSAQTLGVPLRVRLLIDSSAPELGSLYWETLVDPDSHMPLFVGENLFITRYLSSNNWRPVKLRSKSTLQALIVAANPAGLVNYQMAPVDVAGELGRVKAALDNISVAELPNAVGNHASIDTIMGNLRQGYDILYIVAHGAMVNGLPFIWLETDDGEIARLPGNDLIARFSELAQPPSLIVLASCESAGKGSGDAFQALGPKLAEAGIPAVLAMQGRISMNTVKMFMPTFFRELNKDGQIDRALAVARGVVRNQNDFWMPVLFMRLKNGKIWSDDAKESSVPPIQFRILNFFQQKNVTNSSKVDVNMIAQHLKLSTKVVQLHLDDSVKRGWVKSEPRQARGSLIVYFYELTPKGIEILERG